MVLVKRYVMIGALSLIGIVGLTACGNVTSSSLQNTPVSHTYNPRAVRLNTPGHFQPVIRICDGTTAIYTGTDGGLMAIANSPSCKGAPVYK